MDRTKISNMFFALEMFNPFVGFAFGVLAYSTAISQMVCVPELLIYTQTTMEADREGPTKEYFRLPLFLATLMACSLKILFGIAGAMAFTDSGNVFDNLLFSKNTPDAVLIIVTLFVGVVVLPQAVDQQRQAKYFASISSENDSIPCNQYLVGIILPWILAIVLNHLQIFAILVNWTSLILIVSVSITCSFLMWATQMDEAITHEKNFRDSVKSLVV